MPIYDWEQVGPFVISMKKIWHLIMRIPFTKWSFWSAVILWLSGVTMFLVFFLAPYLKPNAEPNSTESLLWWFHLLATVALLSSALWSLFAFCGVYIGPFSFWKHRDEFGPNIFLAASVVYLAGVGVYVFAIQQVWSDSVHHYFACRGFDSLYYGVHNHIFLIALTEGLFWFFDLIIIRRINLLEASWKAQNVERSTYEWAVDLRHQLRAWIYYVDRPATVAFFCLLLSGIYLEYTDVLLNHTEIEMFTSGAVFFSLMTANLAFYAVNRQTPEPSPELAGDNLVGREPDGFPQEQATD